MCHEYCGKIRGTTFLKSFAFIFVHVNTDGTGEPRTPIHLALFPLGDLQSLLTTTPNPVNKDHKDTWWLSLFLKHSQCWCSSTLYWQKGNIGSVLCSLKSLCITIWHLQVWLTQNIVFFSWVLNELRSSQGYRCVFRKKSLQDFSS